MEVSFERFKAADGVLLRGWFTDAPGDAVLIHVHGMSGNGYENRFLDSQRQKFNDGGLAFFSFDNRGSGIINHFPSDSGTKLGGSCYEIFEESAADIQGAIDFMKSKGKTRFVLQGHSLGGSKAVNYLLTGPEQGVLAVILLAPTDMVGWAKTDPEHDIYLEKAKKLIAEGKPEELVGAQCWLDKTPLSAQTYPSITDANSAVDIYAPRPDGALLSKVKVPMIIIYGDKDIGEEKIDGDATAWQARVSKLINDKTDIKIIAGANHGFTGFEEELAEQSLGYLKNEVKL